MLWKSEKKLKTHTLMKLRKCETQEAKSENIFINYNSVSANIIIQKYVVLFFVTLRCFCQLYLSLHTHIVLYMYQVCTVQEEQLQARKALTLW